MPIRARRSDALIATMAEQYVAELAALQDLFRAHVRQFVGKGLKAENTTSLEDCRFLYLVIRHFKRTRALDVGTNVGTTAVAINDAVRRNGGTTCITCDPIDYAALPPDKGIRFIHAPSSEALAILHREQQGIDFAFFDWVPDKATVRLANEVFTRDAVLAVHDYEIDPKGEEIVKAINAGYRRSGKWYFPSGSAEFNGIKINICTALWVPGEPRWRSLVSALFRQIRDRT